MRRLFGPLLAAALAVPVGAVALPARADTPPVTVTVALAPADPAGLGRLAAAPAGAHDRSRLAAVSPSARGRARVAAWLRARGLKVVGGDGWSVTATADRATARAAFPGGMLPRALRTDATAVVGLAGGPVWRHHATAPQPYTPSEVGAAYAVPAGATGRGVTVASVQFSGWSQLANPSSGDLAKYAQTMGLTLPKVVPVSVNRADPAVPSGPGADFEVAMDQEAVLAGAPAATQRVYVTSNDVQGGVLVWQRIADDVAAGVPIGVVTTSWGDCEQDLGSQAIQAIEVQIERLNAMGVTVFAASGDSAAYDCAPGTGFEDQPAVDYPASSPFVVAVGGTTLTHSDGLWSETAWGPDDLAVGPADGSGGGVSAVFDRPAWQRGVTGLPSRRLVPDIAAVADPADGFAVYWSGDPSGQAWWAGAGTSLGAPLQAGQFASALSTLGLIHGVGDLHPVLYAHPQAFRDVAVGTNGGYPAEGGYDLATGLGSPQWRALSVYLRQPALVAPAGTSDGAVWVDVSLPTSLTVVGSALGEGVSGCGGLNAFRPAADSVVRIRTAPGGASTSVGLAVRTDDGGCLASSQPVVFDQLAPVPTVGLRTVPDGRLRMSWTATDAAPSSGVTYALRVTAQAPGAAPATWLTTYAGTAGSVLLATRPGVTYRAQVVAVDGAGNRSNPVWSPVVVAPPQPVAARQAR